MIIWIIQQKLFKGDWETVATSDKRTKAEALQLYLHMNGKLRAVSVVQAERDYQAGRADDYKRKLQLEKLKREKRNSAIHPQDHADEGFYAEQQAVAEQGYRSYLAQRGITEERHVAEVYDWCDRQD